MHVLNDNLITILGSLFKLEVEISYKLCSRMNEKDSCMKIHCANCVLLGNCYSSPEDYPNLIVKTSQSLKGSSNEP